MFGIGFGEVVLILVIALLIYGPERLPTVAKKIALVIRHYRKISDDLQKSIEKELEFEKEIKEQMKIDGPRD